MATIDWWFRDRSNWKLPPIYTRVRKLRKNGNKNKKSGKVRKIFWLYYSGILYAWEFQSLLLQIMSELFKALLNFYPNGLHKISSWFLATLDFVSRATVMEGAGVRRPSVRPSSVRKLKFLGNLCMDRGQILWVAPSPPYFQTIFFCFFIIFNFHFL